jgi:nucleoside-diphosphate-sugar epimerase
METTTMKNKVILLTGATGVIGTNFLLDYEYNKPHEDTTFYAVHNRPLPKHLAELYHVRFIQGDLTDVEFVRGLPCADIIIHGATYSSPKMFSEHPIKTIQLNTTTTIGLLDRLNEGGRFLYLSSVEVYTGLPEHPFRETETGSTLPLHPRGCYIESKKCGEVICVASGKEASIVRLGHIYGAGAKSDDGRVLYDFIKQAMAYDGITIKGGAGNKRGYCYAPDAVNMMWNVIEKGEGLIYNIGSEETTTIRGLAAVIATTMGVWAVSKYPDDWGELPSLEMDMRKYNEEFGRYPYTPLSEGIKKTIEWMKNN